MYLNFLLGSFGGSQYVSELWAYLYLLHNSVFKAFLWFNNSMLMDYGLNRIAIVGMLHLLHNPCVQNN